MIMGGSTVGTMKEFKGDKGHVLEVLCLCGVDDWLYASRCSECFTKPKRVSRKNVTRMAAGSAPLPTEKAQKIGEKCAKNARKALKRTLYPRTGYSTPAVMCDDDASLNRITTIFTWRL